MYVVPAPKKSIDQDKFKFKIGDDEYTATRFDLLPSSFVESIAELPEKHVMKALRLALAGDNESLAETLGELPIAAVSDLIQAWQKESGVALGE